MHTYVIALDQGTTSSRAVLFDENARIDAMKSYEFEQIYPQPGWVEHDPNELFDSQARKICSSTQEYRLITESHFVVEQEVSVYWEAFKAGLREVLAESRLSGREILALSVSAQGETMVFLDEDGRPLSRAIVWMDNRAQEEARFLAGRFDPDEIHRATGQTDVIPLSPGCKVLWFKRNRPALFERLGKILLLGTRV